jgi:hypothetical protein
MIANRSNVGSWSFRHWWLAAWNLWTAPHNVLVVMVTAFIMIQSRAWRIRGALPEPTPRAAPMRNAAFPQTVVLES